MTDLGTVDVIMMNNNVVQIRTDAKLVVPIATTPPITKTISGVVRDHIKQPAQRKIYAFRRSTGQFLGEVLSSPTTGAYQIDVPNEEIIVVALDDNDSPLLNDLINRVLPE